MVTEKRSKHDWLTLVKVEENRGGEFVANT